MVDLALGGQEADYDSKKSRSKIVNLIPEGDRKTGYKSVKRVDGLTLFSTISDAPVRSDLLVNDNFIYVVVGINLYRVNMAGTAVDLGSVGGSGRAKLMANSVPGDSQILILNGSGDGYIYDNANGLVIISDPDFFNSTSVTILNERFWLTRDGTNEFFGSDISDGTSYNPLTFGSAEEAPDDIIATIAKKSALWNIGSRTTEYWQTFTDPILPLRQVKGSTKEWGIIAKDSLAEVNDYFAFLADDRTVHMMQGTRLVEISDLDFNLKIKGNGTAAFPGFSTVDDAIGFFVNGPVHSIYYLTFPTEGYTWGYDINTGLSHIRESDGLGRWRVNGAVKFGAKIICGDSVTGKLWILDPDNRTEDDEILRTKLITDFISFEKNITIPLIEIDMEVAQTTDPESDPKMMVYFTKDGGNTWVNKGHISLGNYGEHKTRVPLRNFGRLVRNKDFGLKLEVTDPIGVQFYGAKIHPEVDM